jgi:hypothetical protein
MQVSSRSVRSIAVSTLLVGRLTYKSDAEDVLVTRRRDETSAHPDLEG